MIQPFLVFNDWGLLLVRVVLGVVLIVHGLPKLRDLKGTGSWMAKQGFRPGGFWAFIVGVLETVGGGMIVVGILTQVVAALVAIQFIVIFLTVKRKATFDDKEKDLFILASALLLITMAGGDLSLDNYWGILLY